MKHLSILLTMLLVFYLPAHSTTVVVTSPEYNVRVAPLIVEAVVLDMRYEESLKGIPFAVIRLQVEDRIAGNSPNLIEIRRAFVTPDLKFLDAELIPTYKLGERFIIALVPDENGYNTIGLYNGKFVISNNTIRNTGIMVAQFKRQILQVRNGTLASFPASLPRHGLEPGRDKKMVTIQNSLQMMACGDGVPHLGGAFRVWDFTWNTSYLPAMMHYNHDGEPLHAPPPAEMGELAELAYGLWEDENSFFSIQNADPFFSPEKHTDNNTSVIFWDNLDNLNLYSKALPYPNTEERILNCTTLGRGSNRAVDVVFNTDINGT